MPQSDPQPALVDAARLFKSVEILSAGAAHAEAPTEVRLFSAGPVETTKGTFQFTPTSAETVLAKAADYGNDLNFDYGHAMLGVFQLDPAEAGKAAGWYRLEVRNNELWAVDIRWTPRARDMILSREYRYISPAFITSQDGEILELINCALTNIPATKRLKPLMASRNAEDSKMLKSFIQMLGLAENATEADVMAAFTADRAIAGEVSKLTGKNGAEAVAVVQAWKVGAEKTAELSAKLAEIETARITAERDALVKQGSADGKIPPALVEWAKGQTVDSLKAFLAVAPALVQPTPAPAPAPAEKPEDAGVELTADEIKVAKMLGQDLAKVKANKAARLAAEKE